MVGANRGIEGGDAMSKPHEYLTLALKLAGQINDPAEATGALLRSANAQITISASDAARETVRSAWEQIKKGESTRDVSGYEALTWLSVLAHLVELQRQLDMSAEIEDTVRFAREFAENARELEKNRGLSILGLFYNPDVGLVSVLASAGRIQDAVELAQQIGGGRDLEVALQVACRAQIEARQFQQARTTIDKTQGLLAAELLTELALANPEFDSEARSSLEQIEAGAMDRKVFLSSPQERATFDEEMRVVAQSLARLGGAQARKGQMDAARQDFAKALELAEQIADSATRSMVLRQISEDYAEAGFSQETRDVLLKAREVAYRAEILHRAPLLAGTARIQVELGLVKDALETLELASEALKEFEGSEQARNHYGGDMFKEMQEQHRGSVDEVYAMAYARSREEERAMGFAEKLKPPDRARFLVWMAVEYARKE